MNLRYLHGDTAQQLVPHGRLEAGGECAYSHSGTREEAQPFKGPSDASSPLPPSSSPQKASTRFTLIPTNAADPTSIHTQVCEETLFTAGHRHGRHRAGKGRECH